LLSSLLLTTGGLATLQNFVVLLGFPIAFIIALCLVGLTIELEQLRPVLLTDRARDSDDTDSDQQSVAGYLSDRTPGWMDRAD
jgi:glycine betaine transporter